MALGDLNDDGALDIVAGEFIYFNDEGGIFGVGQPFGTGDGVESVAVGDLNGDGALDIVVGTSRGHNYIVLNDGAGAFGVAKQFGPVYMYGEAKSVAVGDLNGDGALDIVTGIARTPGNVLSDGQNFVYFNDGAGGFEMGQPFGPGDDDTFSVALGDVNGDGALDIVVGNWGRSNQSSVHLNDGVGGFDVGSPFGPFWDSSSRVAVGDINGDGALDIVVGTYLNQNFVYLNDGAGGFGSGRPFGPGDDGTRGVALGDLNDDGVLDIVASNLDGPSLVHLQTTRSPRLGIRRPGPTANANFYSTPAILDSQVIPIPFKLCSDGSSHIGRVEVSYSLDGAGSWREAVGAANAQTTNLPVSQTTTQNPCYPDQQSTPYPWDTFASGFFGQSDNVVIRMVAYSQPLSTTLAAPGTYRYTNSAAGPYQWPAVSAVTFPFRVRGTQVQVVSDATPAIRLPQALVYRLPANQLDGGHPIGQGGIPWRTDARGFLAGRGEVRPGDSLTALWPVAPPPAFATPMGDSVQLFHTNITPTVSGLDALTVKAAGVQTITVSAQKPLLLFSLTVALEWDASADLLYHRQLERNLQRASALLFDWTNGQAALGPVTVYHNAPMVPPRETDDWQPWRDADIRIHANNRLRPNADIGGIVTAPVIDVTNPMVAYTPGQIRMPAVWNRYGAEGDDTNDDWARALAHELGHYLFFLEDNYLGFDAAGRLVDVHDCPGVMSDPFRDDTSEFHPQAGWQTNCAGTLANQTTGRADWQTIHAFYPALHPPGPSVHINDVLAGPNSLPLALTTVRTVTATKTTAPLPNPFFFLVQEGVGRVVADEGARAFLFQEDRVIDLGRPNADQLLARGARPGDRLCVYEFASAATRVGCKEIAPGDNQIALHTLDDWRPNLTVEQIDHVEHSTGISYTVTAKVTGVAIQSLRARFYLLGATASPTATVANNGVVTLTLAEPPVAGFIRLWQAGASPAREVVTDFSVGGTPCCRRSGSRAPMVSNDGQVLLYLEPGVTVPDGEFYTLQTLPAPPSPPPWNTLVGRVFHLTKSAGAPAFEHLSVNFQYLGREVPPGEERFLRAYFSPDGGASWRLIKEATVNRTVNSVAMPAQGAGLYALMSSHEIALTPGWNSIAYPVAASSTVTTALASIAGSYQVAYHLTPGSTGAAEIWRVHAPDAPRWVDDLTEVTFGQGYLLYATQPVTLYLKGAGVETVTAAASLAPPATYYVTATIPVAIQAWIAGVQCGAGQAVQDRASQLVGYRIKVADGCGSLDPGRTVTFTVNGTPAGSAIPWDNTQVQPVNLTPAQYTVVVDVEGEGAVQVTLAKSSYSHNELITLVATPSPGWRFFAWSGHASGSEQTVQIHVSGNLHITAIFVADGSGPALQYTVVVNVVGEGMVDVTPTKTSYSYNDVITLVAIPAPGWGFFAWSGHATGIEPSLQMPVRRNLRITANFVTDTSDETILAISLIGRGQVQVTPAQDRYARDDTVVLTAVADTDWFFMSWGGDLSGDTNPASLTMQNDRLITATFAATPAGFVTTNVRGGRVKVMPEKPFYMVGDAVTLEAVPDDGWRFEQWEVFGKTLAADAQTSQNPFPIIVDGQTMYTPKFVLIQSEGDDNNMFYLPIVTR